MHVGHNYKENGLEEGHDLFVVVLFGSQPSTVRKHGHTVPGTQREERKERDIGKCCYGI